MNNTDEEMPKWARRSFKSKEPPWDQIKERNNLVRLKTGPWGYFLRTCYENPNEWFRSHPVYAKHTVQQVSSDINTWKFFERRTNRVVGFNEKGDPVSKADGDWDVRWGFDADDNGFEHWFVWCRWVPKKKRARGAKARQTRSRQAREDARDRRTKADE